MTGDNETTVIGTVSTPSGDQDLKHNPAIESACNAVLMCAMVNAESAGLTSSQTLDVLANAFAIYFAEAVTDAHWPAARERILAQMPGLIDGQKRLAQMKNAKGRA